MSGQDRPLWRADGWIIGGVGVAARLAVVAWAAKRFPPTADATFYHRIAERIAAGLGYTWAWPDGAVTFAAHYPIGYPGALGALYALVGPRASVAMALNAVLGALAAVAVHRLAARATSRRGAIVAGLLVALHPGLVAYTPALMTEGVTAALTACAAWAAMRAREADHRGTRWIGPIAVVGLLVGAMTLVRPQSLLLAPSLGALALAGSMAPGRRSRWIRPLQGAAVATLVASGVCAPWTLRNCARMERCAVVSVNGGWNLLIGTDEAGGGAWAPIQVPDACREVWGEADKDACFQREAIQSIARSPARWLSMAPGKLAATFDYCGAAGWYLHASNPNAFDQGQKVLLGVVETAYERAVLLLALVWAARVGRRMPGREGTEPHAPYEPGTAPERGHLPDGREKSHLGRLRVAIALVGGAFLFMVHAWVSYVAFVVVAALAGRRLLYGPVLGSNAVAAVLVCAATHAVYFGAGRYGLVVFPLLCGVAGLAVGGFDNAPRSPASFVSRRRADAPD